MDNLAVLIPAYNEEITIEKVVNDVKKATEKIPNTKIYVYDNNSTDNTVEYAKRAGATVRHEFQQGKGAVIRRMFREIDANVYIMLDADDTYPSEAIPEMYNRIMERKVDMVVGDRLSSTYFEENKRPFHNVGNTVVRLLINNLFETNIKDILTGFRAFSFQFVKTFPVLSTGFEIETEMSIHASERKLFIENQVITYRDRPDGSDSKLNTYSDGFRVIKLLFRLFRVYHPFKFFGLLSLVFILPGILAFIFRVLIPFSNTGVVRNFPTLIVSMIFILIGILSIFAGSILDSLQSQDQRKFEMDLMNSRREKETLNTEK